MDHRSFWDLVRARWVTLVAFTLLGVVGASTYLLTTEPEYSAQAELFVAAVGSDNSSDLAQGSNYSQQQARIYSVFATREVVLEPVIDSLELNTTTRELARRVSASVPLNTSLISITVTDSSPDRAAATANAVATSVVNTVVRVVPKRTDGTTPVRLETIQSATSPVVSAAFSPPIIVIAGLIGGLVAGLALVILREVASTRVRAVNQVEQSTGLGILGSVVHDRSASKTPLILESTSGSARFEEFRQLRTNLRLIQEDEARSTFVVTSSIPGEGRSVTAANLAIAFAASGNSVCLIEADLRHPSLQGHFGFATNAGLTTILSGDVALDDVLNAWGDDGLRVLLAGTVPANPTELLESAEALAVLDELTERFEVVVIDSPPVLPVADASILARAFGGALLVVGTGRVETRELRMAVETLRAAGTAAFGVILNDVPARAAGRFRNAYSGSADKGMRLPPAKTPGRLGNRPQQRQPTVGVTTNDDPLVSDDHRDTSQPQAGRGTPDGASEARGVDPKSSAPEAPSRAAADEVDSPGARTPRKTEARS